MLHNYDDTNNIYELINDPLQIDYPKYSVFIASIYLISVTYYFLI